MPSYLLSGSIARSCLIKGIRHNALCQESAKQEAMEVRIGSTCLTSMQLVMLSQMRVYAASDVECTQIDFDEPFDSRAQVSQNHPFRLKNIYSSFTGVSSVVNNVG